MAQTRSRQASHPRTTSHASFPTASLATGHRKAFVGSELDKCKDFGEIAFRRPVEKGYIVNWEAQKRFGTASSSTTRRRKKCDPSDTRLILAEHSNSLPALQFHCDQMVFEEFGFTSYYRGPGSCHTFPCRPRPANPC
jgi:actin-related protein 6